jgi:hypothetical protein
VAALRSGPGPLILAAVCCLIAAGILLPVPGVRGTVALAAATALAMWARGQDFGGIATGMGTDPGTGPVLALLAVSYWPSRALTRGAAPAGMPVPTGAGAARAPGPGPGRMPFPRRMSRAGALVRAGSRRAGGAVLVTQVIMGAATAGMLVPRFDPVPLVAWQILAAYEQMRRRLDDQLGIRPGRELADAHMRVLRNLGQAPLARPGRIAAFRAREHSLRQGMTPV